MKRQRALLAAITVLFWFSQYTYPPYYGPYLNLLGAGALFVGLASGVYGLAQLLCRIPTGILADLMGRQKAFIALGVLLSGVAGLGMQLTANLWAVLLLRALSGVGASMWVCYTVLFTGYYPAGQSHKAISSINVCNNGGRLAAAFVGSLGAQAFGIRAPFWLSFAGGALGFLLCFFLKDAAEAPKTPQLGRLFAAAKKPFLLYASLLAVVYQGILFATTYSFTSNYAYAIGAQDSQIGLISVAYNLSATAVTLLAGRVFVRFPGEKWSLAIGFALIAAHCFFTPWADSVQQLYLLQVLSGMGGGLVLTFSMSMAIKRADSAVRSTRMGVYQALYSAGMMLGPVLAGALVQGWGFAVNYTVLGLIACLALGLVLLLHTRMDRRDELASQR